MIEAESIQQVNEILGRRREYFSRFDPPARPTGMKFSDVDYAFSWHLIDRLGISSIHADLPEVAGLFAASSSSSLSVSTAGEATAAVVPATADSFGTLWLFTPGSRPVTAWLKAATAAASVALCYGLTEPLGTEWVETMRALGTGAPVFIPLFGAAPALWRAASLLIGRRNQQAVLTGAVKTFVDCFSGEDLNPLFLAEENLRLRVRVRQLAVPGGDESETNRLRGSVATLESLVASLRRAGLQQEKTIAALRRARSVVTDRSPTNGDAGAGKQA